MTTVYVVTAGSGDTYRIERIFLDGDEARGVRQRLQRHRTRRTGSRGGMADRHTAAAYDGPYWRAEWWGMSRRASAAPRCETPTRGERFDDFVIRQEWWTGDALPDAKVVRRELAGLPKVEVVGLSKEKVEETFWETITQVRADLAGIRRK